MGGVSFGAHSHTAWMHIQVFILLECIKFNFVYFWLQPSLIQFLFEFITFWMLFVCVYLPPAMSNIKRGRAIGGVGHSWTQGKRGSFTWPDYSGVHVMYKVE